MELSENFKTFSTKLLSKKQNLLYLLIVVAITLFWRIFELFQLEKLSQAETTLVKSIIRIGEGSSVTANEVFKSIYIYAFSFLGGLAEYNVIFMRLIQVTIATSLVIVFYYFVKSWFNRQTAILASILFSTNYFMVLTSRNLEPKILAPLIILSVVSILTVALRTNKIGYFIVAGLLSGMLFYVDKIFIFLPFIGLAGFAYLYNKSKKAFNHYLNGLLTASFLSLLTGSFAIFTFFKDFVPNILLFAPGSIGQFYLNLGSNLQTLFYKAPVNQALNVGTEPLLDPFISLSFICGVVYALFYLRRKKFILLVSWFTLALFMISLKKDQAIVDSIIFMPVIFTLSAIMLDYVLTHWVRTFPFNKLARMLMTFIFSLFLFLSVFYNYQKYFWAFSRPENLEKIYVNRIEDIRK